MGRSHAGLLTHGGELYTWGSGGGARLGHGHGGPASTPQRVHTLWGAAATAVKCSDSASAAVSQVRSRRHTARDADILTWVAYSSMPCCRTTHPHRAQIYRGCSQSQDNIHGGFLQDGCLYTWGDGSAGHLGYGHPSRQYIPRPVGGPLARHIVAQVGTVAASLKLLCHFGLQDCVHLLSLSLLKVAFAPIRFHVGHTTWLR